MTMSLGQFYYWANKLNLSSRSKSTNKTNDLTAQAQAAAGSPTTYQGVRRPQKVPLESRVGEEQLKQAQAAQEAQLKKNYGNLDAGNKGEDKT